jgi:ADP-ribose pyrophosphatase
MKIKQVKVLAEGKLFKIVEKEYSHKKDKITRIVVEHPGAVAILPLIDDTHFIILKQYRHSLEKYIYEIPAGTLQKGESSKDCALRELEEETGYKAGKILEMGSFYLAPGYSTELITIYLAWNLRKGKSHPEKYENIQPVQMSCAKALDLIDKGIIKDAKTIIAVFFYATYRIC